MSMYQTFTVLLIFCFTTGFGLEEYGCTLDENYGVQHDSDKDIEYPVWGKKTSPVELTKSEYNELITKISAARKTILDQYLYDETQVTTLFSEYDKKIVQEKKSFKKPSWEQYLADHSLDMEFRQDELGLTMKIFKQLFHSLNGSSSLDPEVVKKASYFAAVTNKKMIELLEKELPKNEDMYGSIGVVEMLYEGNVIYILIHPFMDRWNGTAILPPVLNRIELSQPSYGSLKGEMSIFIRDDKLDVNYDDSHQDDDTIYITRPLCSFTYTANLKINDPLIIFGKWVELTGLDSYIVTSVDGTGSPDFLYCKEISKEKKFCIGYTDFSKPGALMKEATFGSVKEMKEDDRLLLRIVADRMNNTYHPVTFDKLMSKLTELDDFVEAYRRSSKSKIQEYARKLWKKLQ